MKQCNTIQSLLPGYLSCELWPEERNMVEHHLHSCGGCSQTLKKYKKIDAELENREEVPPVLHHKILQNTQIELLKNHHAFDRDNHLGKEEAVAAPGTGIVRETFFGLLLGNFLSNDSGATIGVVVDSLIWYEKTILTALIAFGGFQHKNHKLRKMTMLTLTFTNREYLLNHKSTYYFLK